MRRRHLLVRAGLLLVVAACGNKTAVLPPDTIQPTPPGALLARSAVAGVQLDWRRPTEYTGGARMNDLGGFEIERAPGDSPIDFTRVGTLTLDDQTRFRPQRDMQWVDATAVPGMRYFYRVIAVTLDGYRSLPAGPVAITFDPTKVDPPQTGQ